MKYVTKPKFCSTPYIDDVSVIIKKLLMKLNPKFDVTFSIFNQARKTIFSQCKNFVPSNQKSRLIYRITCGNCHVVYIGGTTQYLGNHIRQHTNDY